METTKIKIFVEGTADKKFISDYIKHLGINFADSDIVVCGGWEKYEKCLESYVANGRKFTLPAIKTKVYAYLEALLEDTRKGKEANRDYTNPEHWDLDSEHLQPLKSFLINIHCN